MPCFSGFGRHLELKGALVEVSEAAVLRALASADPDGARAAMRRHIEASMQRVFVGPGGSAR
jgi:DNA-binding GntR family transcriptional regulator